ncbi:uncharacterized protein V2V93DRAFT_371312 [Kockiozyma suomiensis]|uniref:uncharacterized protein n=1 Tax=Kockiozyma suomiensis TaxID=1337062 RepID=UPI00334344CB
MSMLNTSRRDNGVTVVHVTALHKLSDVEAQHLLDSFLGTLQDPTTTITTTAASTEQENVHTTQQSTAGSAGKLASLSNSVVQQLNRISRDLLGLPPVLRKRKREDIEVSGDVLDDGAEEMEVDGDEKSDKIDKNERKRLKKLRQKEEKRQKHAS